MSERGLEELQEQLVNNPEKIEQNSQEIKEEKKETMLTERALREFENQTSMECAKSYRENVCEINEKLKSVHKSVLSGMYFYYKLLKKERLYSSKSYFKIRK